MSLIKHTTNGKQAYYYKITLVNQLSRKDVFSLGLWSTSGISALKKVYSCYPKSKFSLLSIEKIHFTTNSINLLNIL